MTTHNEKAEAARRAIYRVYRDPSVLAGRAQESLEELLADIDTMLAALEEDKGEDEG